MLNRGQMWSDVCVKDNAQPGGNVDVSSSITSYLPASLQVRSGSFLPVFIDVL